MNEHYYDYSKTQENTASGFYIALAISWIIIIAGLVWTGFDIVSPSGKLRIFLDLNFFYQIVIVAGFLAGFFFLLVFFIGLSKRGKKFLLRVFFNKIEIEEQFRGKIHIKLATAGLLISLIIIFIGSIAAVIMDGIQGAGTSSISILEYLQSVSTGILILVLGILLSLLIAVALFIIFFWKNGYYLILKIFGGLDK